MTVLLVQGNTLQIPLADRSVQCIVTSPPYWGLRSYAGTAKWEGGDPECNHEAARHKNRFDYPLQTDNIVYQATNPGSAFSRYDSICPTCGARRHDAQLGSEPLHDCLGWATGNDCGECYICHMRQVARECWRVLRDDGVMFWNIADSYATGTTAGRQEGTLNLGNGTNGARQIARCGTPAGLKTKDRCGIPERTALAFQADGWYWRSGITWVKPNPMPESVTDRPTKSTEMIYVFTKRERYFWDAEAVREKSKDPEDDLRRIRQAAEKRNGRKSNDADKTNSYLETWSIRDEPQVNPAGRNLRDAWTIATAPYSGAHFATFPPELPRRCIKAATSERGCCPKCGRAWERNTAIEQIKLDDRQTSGRISGGNTFDTGAGNKSGGWHEYPRTRKAVNTLGWRPACTCDAGEPVPCTVLDPFSGAATTILVARELGRNGIGLELSGEYLQQSRERLGLAALEAWTGGNGNGKHNNLDDLPMFKR